MDDLTDKLCSLTLKDYAVNITTYYLGNMSYIGYQLTWKEEVIFEGKDFKSSPLYDFDSLSCIISLLGFLTVQEGDTDEEYFAGYNEQQFDWLVSIECGNLKTLVNDFLSDEMEFYQEAKLYFEKCFIQY